MAWTLGVKGRRPIEERAERFAGLAAEARQHQLPPRRQVAVGRRLKNSAQEFERWRTPSLQNPLKKSSNANMVRLIRGSQLSPETLATCPLTREGHKIRVIVETAERSLEDFCKRQVVLGT